MTIEPAQPGHRIGLPEQPPPPAPAWYRRWPVWVGVAAMTALCIAAIALAPKKDEPAASPTTPAATSASPFDPAAWEEFAASGAVPPSVARLIQSVYFNGIALVAETSIYPDADAPAAARGVCSVLSAFWLQHGGFRPVQVVGSDGGVLVSRATVSGECEWRR